MCCFCFFISFSYHVTRTTSFLMKMVEYPPFALQKMNIAHSFADLSGKNVLYFWMNKEKHCTEQEYFPFTRFGGRPSDGLQDRLNQTRARDRQ
jgi:hypothetical protein